MVPAGYREDDGLVVPAGDHLIAHYLRQGLAHVDLAVSHCKARNVAVQAGGNCGLWPRRLSEMFEAVYTFEPDPVNFVALAINTADRTNVIRMQAALGDKHSFVDMNRTGKNCGAHYVEGKGLLPTLRVDDLELTACDLIYLDIEGAEASALGGSTRTIKKFGPVIAFEDKGLGKRVGVEQGFLQQCMQASFGYRVAQIVNHDVIMVKN